MTPRARPPGSARPDRWLLVATWVCWGAFFVAVVLRQVFDIELGDMLTNVVLYAGVPLLAGVAVVVHSLRSDRNSNRVIVGVALLFFAGGGLIDSLVDYPSGQIPFPSAADAFYWAFYILLIVTVARVISAASRRNGTGDWLDAMIAVAGCCSVALFVSNLITPASTDAADTIVITLYPALDAALLALALSAFVLDGMRFNQLTKWFLAAVLALLAADITLALQTSTGYVEGGYVDVVWLFAMAALATSSFGTVGETKPDEYAGTRLALPGVAAVLAAGVLVWDHFRPTSDVAVSLAAVTLVFIAVRTTSSTRQLRDLWRTQHEARSDPLTGLPNRRALGESLGRFVESDLPFTCLVADLNGFKEVNDTLGHAAGDAVLKVVSRRLDSINGFPAPFRTGGDEFMFLFAGDPTHAEELVDSIHRSMTPPILLDGIDASVSASLGYACWPSDSRDVDELLSMGDSAMYQAKHTGRRVVAHADMAEITPGSPRFEILQVLRAQIERAEVHLDYQPQVDLATTRLVGIEALARLRSSDLPPTGPDVFIPILESAGLIVEFTRLVIEQAVTDTLWLQGRALTPQISVNLPISCLHSADFIEWFEPFLRDVAVGLSEPLMLELTEEAMMYEVPEALDTLNRLRELGCRVAMDDFGKGYSSISRLRSLPFDVLKIDKGVLDGDPGEPETSAVVRAVASLGSAIGVTTLAEGVETAEQADLLRDAGIWKAQGYHFGRPMAINRVPAWERQELAAIRAAIEEQPGPEPLSSEELHR